MKELANDWKIPTKEEEKIILEKLKDFPEIKRKIINMMFIFPKYQYELKIKNKERQRTTADKLRELADIVDELEFNS